MDNNNNISSKVESGSFFCIHCAKLIQHDWYCLELGPDWGGRIDNFTWNDSRTGQYLARCIGCKQHSLWKNRQMLYPDPADLPRQPLPEEAGQTAIEYHKEAARIATRSPRAANAMLRASLEALLKNITENSSNKSLNKLIEKNKEHFSELILNSMQTLRITGNKSLHPNKIYSKDQIPVEQMLWLLEYVSREVITNPRKRKEIHFSQEKEQLQDAPSNPADAEN